MNRILKFLAVFLATAGCGLLLAPFILEESPWPVGARDHLESRGFQESGAINTVSAIYLGYRIFDTLGETIVLLVAVSGTIGIIASAGTALARGFEGDGKSGASKTRLRTALLEVVTGKLGPVVLVFGFYVMLYGHLSPGGGFQGGVVIASGIVFLALGGREGASTRLTEPGVLSAIEATAFVLLVLAGMSGMLGEGGFFANTLELLGLPEVSFIVLLNAVIGLKVGAGIGFMCIAMLGRVGH